MNKRKIGNEHETVACNFLKKNGLKVLNRNFESHFGEIDIICKDKDTYVFVEVKYRKSFLSGSGEEAVGFSKQRVICKVSDYYRVINNINEFTPIRYDVIAMNDTDITWYKNAFDYICT